MGQLFNRISRVVRADLNSNTDEYSEGVYLNEGTALGVGGAVMGASIGKVGILAGGTGYRLGATPLTALGALTGLALYEALRSFIEGDTSSVNVAVIGAATGAVTSAAIGGVGVAVGGSAIGVDVVSMAAGGAVVGLGLVGLNRLLQQGIDPEQLLDSAIEQMERDLDKARQASINVIASQKRLQQQYEKVEAEVTLWERRVKLALQKGNDYLAREALNRKIIHSETLDSLKAQLDQQPTSVQQRLQQQYEKVEAEVTLWERRVKLALQKGNDYLAREALNRKIIHSETLNNLKVQLDQQPTSAQNLACLATKISEAKTMRTSLKSQMTIAKVNGNLQSIVNRVENGSAMTAFNRMEEKILQMEALSQAEEELAGTNLELDSLVLVSFPNGDEELATMKAQLMGVPQPVPSQSLDSADMELENLKRMMDNL